MIVPALEAAEVLIAEGKDEEAKALLANVPLQSKAMILSMKDFLEASGDPEAKEKVAQIMAEEFPVRIGFTEQGWFGIHMMPLAKTPDSASKEFVREILTPALKKRDRTADLLNAILLPCDFGLECSENKQNAARIRRFPPL